MTKFGQGIQVPLAGPDEQRLVAEGVEVRDRPLVPVRAAGSNHVSEDVEVDGDEGERCGLEAALAGYNECNDDGESEIMTDDVVIVGPPEQRMRRIACRELRDHAEAVEVRNGRGDHDRDLVPAVQFGWSSAGHQPVRMCVVGCMLWIRRCGRYEVLKGGRGTSRHPTVETSLYGRRK